jgi:signal transduction histidine kinase
MNLDPLDIFSETIAQPLKRLVLFYLAMITGGWIGGISLNVDAAKWQIFGLREFANGFMLPFAMFLSSAAVLMVPAFLFFIVSSWRLAWIWFIVAAASSVFMLVDREASIGWIAWVVLNTGLAGMVWTHDAWQKARWSQSLAELNAYNSLQRVIRENQNSQSSESEERDESLETTRPLQEP